MRGQQRRMTRLDWPALIPRRPPTCGNSRSSATRYARKPCDRPMRWLMRNAGQARQPVVRPSMRGQLDLAPGSAARRGMRSYGQCSGEPTGNGEPSPTSEEGLDRGCDRLCVTIEPDQARPNMRQTVECSTGPGRRAPPRPFMRIACQTRDAPTISSVGEWPRSFMRGVQVTAADVTAPTTIADGRDRLCVHNHAV